jgi:hypothetical protein
LERCRGWDDWLSEKGLVVEKETSSQRRGIPLDAGSKRVAMTELICSSSKMNKYSFVSSLT